MLKVKVKQFISGGLAIMMVISMMLPTLPVFAESNEKYPYTIFAASDKEGAITVNAVNCSVNGNVGTNGTIISTGNTNINGTKQENASVKMINILEKLNTTYFSDSNVERHLNNYSKKDMNININNPIDVQGELELEEKTA